MDAVVTAGGLTSPKDPLYGFTKGGYKALLEINGKPMVQWVLDALSGTDRIDTVVVVGLPTDTTLHCSHPLLIVEDQGDMIRNIQAGVVCLDRVHPQEDHCLVVSSDIPGIRSEMIAWLVDTVLAGNADIVYNVIGRSVMEERFPGSRRTYVTLKGESFCGGDANAIRKTLTRATSPLASQLVAARKNPIRQASLVGFGTVMRLLFGKLSLDQAVEAICRRMKISGQAVRCPYAELGMDVDKPFQYEIMRNYLESGLNL
jgi:molybdopterin-guanine dinucleotide biosynthesis protein A